MRIVSKLLMAATAAAAITAMTAGTALADPPPGVTPKLTDVVGVGSDTIQNVFDQFSHDYNTTHKTGQLFSFDATNPTTGAMGDPIQLKKSSPASTCNIPRPDGSSAGITALENTKSSGGHPCIDFARSSRPPASTDPATITFINLAGDAVTYATQPGSNAPKNMTVADLLGIYNCSITKWNQIPGNSGGSSATINAFIPQAGSGTRAFFLSAIGGPTFAPGPCVSSSATRAGAAGAGDNTLQENQADAPILNKAKANDIWPFSIGKWIAERFHSGSCGTVAQCFAHPTTCSKTGKNLFGCNTSGTAVLNGSTTTGGTVTPPTTGTGGKTVINKAFNPVLTRILFEVVNQPAGNGTIPANLAPYFGPTGFTCTNSTAKTDLKNYGFLVLPAGTAAGDCGAAVKG